MPNVSKRRTGEFIRILYGILKTQPEGMRAAEALAQLEKKVTLTDYEASDYESGGRRFERIVRFGTIVHVKAGWLVKEKGVWSLTPDGEAALEKYPDPEQFQRAAGKLYRKWKSAQPTTDLDDDEDVSEGSATITLEQAEEMAWAEIESFLAKMPPYEFQELVAALLKAMGYHVAWVAPPGKDGGIDVVAFNDPLGTRPPRIKAQVKRNAGSARIDVSGLRSFMAVLNDDDVGLYVALSGFTRDAELEARNSHRRVTLLDALALVELWTTHYQNLDETARQRLPLRPVWFLATDD